MGCYKTLAFSHADIFLGLFKKPIDYVETTCIMISLVQIVLLKRTGNQMDTQMEETNIMIDWNWMLLWTTLLLE